MLGGLLMFGPLVFCLLASTTLASFCGKSGVPYSLEVLPNGAPVLGCAQPSCVISTLDADREFLEDSQFLTDANGQSDGFFRDGDRALKRFRHEQAPKLIANCSGQFNELSCPRRNQWVGRVEIHAKIIRDIRMCDKTNVGGIEYIDHPRQPLILQCCTFEGLRFSQEVGSTTIGPGEAITGGEVVRAGRQISFDVIANVKKVVKAETSGSKVSYEVTVRRMNCLPDPPEPEVEIDANVPAEVAKVLSNAKNKELSDKLKDGHKQPAAGKKPSGPQKQQKLKAPAAVKQQQQAAKAAPTRELLPEISGGEGERPLVVPELQQQQQPAKLNSEAVLHPVLRQPEFGGSQQQQQPGPQLVEQQQLGPQVQQPQLISQQQPEFGGQQFGGQQNQFAVPDPSQGQQFQAGDPSQQQQQSQQQQSQFAAQAAASGQTTGHPLLGGLISFPPHSFHTLPPHSFPTLPPHSFPTLPPHSFPTLPPHSFPTLPPHTFPGLFGTTPAPTVVGGSFPSAFAAPSFTATGQHPQLQSAASQSGGFQQGQQQQQQQQFRQNPHSPMQTQHNALPTGHQAPPRMAPAMGTILAAMQGERYPVMHPTLGIIGYSNAPQPGHRAGK